MAHLTLSNETKQQLEQERSRLMNDRKTIMAEIEVSVSAEIDRVIQSLNALLEGAPGVEAVPTDDIVKSVTELLKDATLETPTKADPQSRKTSAKRAKSEANGASSQPQAFDAKQLKRKFKGKGVSEAIADVTQDLELLEQARACAKSIVGAISDGINAELELRHPQKKQGQTNDQGNLTV